MTRKTSPSAATPAARNSSRRADASASPRRPVSAPSPSATSGAPASGYPRPVTSATFEAEFVAFNEFRKLCGVDPVPRVVFRGIVEKHNAKLGYVDNPVPEA
jgi:hypothetical protein